MILAFTIMRYAHLAALVLHSPSLFQGRELNDEAGSEDMYYAPGKKERDVKKERRQMKCRTCEHVSSEFSIIVYQGAIFFAQYILLKWHYFFEGDYSANGMNYPELDVALTNIGPVRDWLVIECFCFYIYLHATVFYILGHQLKAWCSKKSDSVSDIRKTETDFI